MPSIAPAPPSQIFNARKRRRDDNHSSSVPLDGSAMSFEMQMKIATRYAYFLFSILSHPDIELTTNVSSPHMARRQTTTLLEADKVCDIFNQRKHMLPRSRDAPKRQRPSGSSDTWNTIDDMETAVGYCAKQQNGIPPVQTPVKIDLSPCYICHRKPSERKELDGYSNCENCGRRTCYVCIRQCEGFGVGIVGRGEDWIEDEERDKTFRGPELISSEMTFSFHENMVCVDRGRWDGRNIWKSERRLEHKGKVCSRCCVEKGSDGEVWCLQCLRAEDAD